MDALAGNADHLYEIYEKLDAIKDLAFSTGWGSGMGELKSQGRNWKLASPGEGSMGWVDGYMIGYSLNADDGKRDYKLLKTVAEEFLNFTLSAQFQLAIPIRYCGSYPTNLNVVPLLTKAEVKSMHLDDLIPLPTLTTRQRNGMKLIWDKAKKKSATSLSSN